MKQYNVNWWQYFLHIINLISFLFHQYGKASRPGLSLSAPLLFASHVGAVKACYQDRLIGVWESLELVPGYYLAGEGGTLQG